MLLAFPGILCYGGALFYLEKFIKEEKERKIYHYLNAFGLTPWMCLHLFYLTFRVEHQNMVLSQGLKPVA